MPTKLRLDDSLVDEAVKISGTRTRREAINVALKEYVTRHRQLQILELRGKIDFHLDYDYKARRDKT